jgi:hypothetical protein
LNRDFEKSFAPRSDRRPKSPSSSAPLTQGSRLYIFYFGDKLIFCPQNHLRKPILGALARRRPAAALARRSLRLISAMVAAALFKAPLSRELRCFYRMNSLYKIAGCPFRKHPKNFLIRWRRESLLFIVERIIYNENKKAIMRKFVLLGFIVVFAFSLFAQQQKHEVSVINIEVPVRVFDGDNFVANLTLEDFELFEDGRPQKVEAVYLVRKTSIERAQENQKFFPAVSRYFVLLFEMSEYVSEIGKALDYFFENVISREDSLTVITPMKTYSLKSQAFKLRPAEEIAEQMKGIVRRDIEAGGSEYRNAIQELKMSLVDDDYPLDQKLQIYSSLLQRLENLRNVDQKKLVDFANFLKGK